MNSTIALEYTGSIRRQSILSALLVDTLLVAGGTVLLIAMAQIRIPMFPVPITGQTLGVLLIGAALGPWRSASSVALYLLLGAAGVNVFAGAVGAAAFSGATGGYLISFIPAAMVVGFLAERGLDRSFAGALLTFLVGHTIIFAIGVSWLAALTGWETAIASGFIPFIPGMIIKTGIATALLPVAWKIGRNAH